MTAISRILAADIGGTHTRFGIYVPAKSAPNPDEPGMGAPDMAAPGRIWYAEYSTAALTSFQEAVTRTLRDCGPPPDCAVIATAGPVVGTRCAMPNVAWDIDLERDGPAFGQIIGPRIDHCGAGRVLLVNDFAAQAMACLQPAVDDAEVLQAGEPVADATIGVIGAGTGLGMCSLVPRPATGAGHVVQRYLPVPSEGGHAPFALLGAVGDEWGREDESQYNVFLAAHGLAPTGDTVVSGPGLARLHTFLTGNDLDPAALSVLLRQGKAEATLALFARLYGRACRSFALHSLSLGGLFICGGVASKTPEILRHPAFLREFANSPTYADLLARIPVTLHRAENSGLDGAALLGQHLYG